jgi:O-antigen/teichoic acid export membrane protein
MGIIKRQSLKSSIVNYLGVFLGVVFFIFVFPHILSTEYLGLIGLFQNITWVFVSLPSLGLLHIMYKYFANWKDNDTLSHFNAFALITMGIAALLFALLYIAFRHPIQDFYRTNSALFLPYYLIGIPLVVIQAYSLYFEMYCTMRMRVAIPTFLREIVARVLLIVLVYLFVWNVLDETLFVIGLPVAYLITFLLLLFYAIYILGFKASKPLQYLKNNPDVKTQFAFGGSLFLLSAMLSIQNFVDGLLIPAFLGLEALGIYGRPLVLGQMIQVPLRAIASISLPIIRECIVQHDMNKLKQLHRGLSINLFLIGAFLFVMLIGNTDNLFRLLPEKFGVAKQVLYIIATGRLIDMAFGLNNEILYSSKYYRFIVYLAVGLTLCTIGLNLLLIPHFGINGPALAVSISVVLFNIFKSWFIFVKFKFHGFSKHYISIICLILCTLALMSLIPYMQFIPNHMFMNALANIALNGVAGSLLFLVPLYFLHVSDDFNQFVRLLFSGRIFKGGHRMDEL